jgi:RluA family pseudouridine synthase
MGLSKFRPGEAPSVAQWSGRDIEARVLYRDGLILVVDKPAGLPVHAGPGGGENLEMHFKRLRFGLPRDPALAHRLDRDTSGCLVLGRHRKALTKLGRLFAQSKVTKTYWAVVVGSPREDEGRIEAPLEKKNAQWGWQMRVSDAGQAAVTEWRVLGRAGDVTWLECRPLTGRTHQLRVHLDHIGHPIVGDPIYGPGAKGSPLQLHARSLSIPLYPKRDAVRVTAPAPAHMHELLRRCGWSEAFETGGTAPESRQEESHGP